MTDRESIIHLVAGGTAGTTGAVLTCPLEVLKVRLQSASASSSTSPGSGGPSSSVSSTAARNQARLRFAPTASALPTHHSPATTLLQLAPIHSCRRCPAGPGSSVWVGGGSGAGVWSQLRTIARTEGLGALWKGLGPNVLGVAPSKAVYFYAYSSAKRLLNEGRFVHANTPAVHMCSAAFAGTYSSAKRLLNEGRFVHANTPAVHMCSAAFAGTYSSAKRLLNEGRFVHANTPAVHMCSAAFAGFLTATAVNPVWLVKTRLQLERDKTASSIFSMASKIWRQEGPVGFYKGVTASYMGISETVVQFVVYEYLRQQFLSYSLANGNIIDENSKKGSDFLGFMGCAGAAKLVATSTLYPHEVCRTRMREAPGRHYTGFFTTLFNVYQREGFTALYRGLNVHLLRTIPNTAITMGTYEVVVHFLRTKYLQGECCSKPAS